MPTPNENETIEQFIERCIPIVMDDGTAEDTQQAFAVCTSMFDESKKGKRKMERKQISAAITEASDEGIVKAIFSVTGNIDHGNDRIRSGAFAKTITERGLKVRVLDNHSTNSVNDAIAKTIALREVGRNELPVKTQQAYPDATGGVEITAQFMLDDPRSAGAFKRIKNGLIDEWSFGYDPLDVSHTQEQKDGRDIIVREIGQIKLYEVSPVLFGMNEATSTTDAKSDDAESEPEPQQKAGRAISARNEARMRSIIDSIQGLAAQLEAILPSAEPMEEEPEESAGAEIEQETKETTQHEQKAGPGDTPPTEDVTPLVDIDFDELLNQKLEEI